MLFIQYTIIIENIIRFNFTYFYFLIVFNFFFIFTNCACTAYSNYNFFYKSFEMLFYVCAIFYCILLTTDIIILTFQLELVLKTTFLFIQTVYEGQELNHPFGLCHYKNFLFWNEYRSGGIYKLDQNTKKATLLRSERPPIYEIRTYDAQQQQSTKKP